VDLHETLSGVIRDAFFEARDRGETMYQASDDAAARVLSVVEPSVLRLQVEVDKLLERWESDRREYPTDEDWRAPVADAAVKLCIRELQNAVERARPKMPTLETTKG
jgi:chemotaxis regulatin CheY-phosphate phosphatase CheZ